jgi:hypothetical protein
VAAVPILMAICFFFLMLIPVVLFLFTYIFRQACVLSGLPKPSIVTAAGVMILIRISTTIPEALMDLIVSETCDLAGLPGWETGIIVFFLILPIDLLISAGLHAGLMNIKFGKGIEVWFVQWLIILSIAAAITFVVCTYILVDHLNG